MRNQQLRGLKIMLHQILESLKRQLNPVQKAKSVNYKIKIKITTLSRRAEIVLAFPVAPIIIIKAALEDRWISRTQLIRCQEASKCRFRPSTSRQTVIYKPSKTRVTPRPITMSLSDLRKQLTAIRRSCFIRFSSNNKWESRERPSAIAWHNSIKLVRSSRHLAVDLLVCLTRTAW